MSPQFAMVPMTGGSLPGVPSPSSMTQAQIQAAQLQAHPLLARTLSSCIQPYSRLEYDRSYNPMHPGHNPILCPGDAVVCYAWLPSGPRGGHCAGMACVMPVPVRPCSPHAHAYAHAPAHAYAHVPMHMHIPIPSSRTCTCTCQNAYAAIGRGESRTIEQYFRRRRRSGLGTGLAQSERHRIEYHGRLANKPDAERPRSGYARRCAGVAPPPRAKNTLAAYPFLAFTLRAASGRK